MTTIAESLEAVTVSYNELLDTTYDEYEKDLLNRLGEDLADEIRKTVNRLSPETTDKDTAVVLLAATNTLATWYSQAVEVTNEAMFYGPDKLAEARAREDAAQDILSAFVSGLYHFVKAMVPAEDNPAEETLAE